MAREPFPDEHRFDVRDPTRGFGGAPPAASALTLRAVLAAFGLVACAAGAVALWLVARAALPAVVFAVLALLAFVDLVVVLTRKSHGEPG
jgi:hypothetical protein